MAKVEKTKAEASKHNTSTKSYQPKNRPGDPAR